MGEVTGDAELLDVKATRGGKKPLFELFTSNMAEASGVLVPIPTCAIEAKEQNIKIALKI